MDSHVRAPVAVEITDRRISRRRSHADLNRRRLKRAIAVAEKDPHQVTARGHREYIGYRIAIHVRSFHGFYRLIDLQQLLGHREAATRATQELILVQPGGFGPLLSGIRDRLDDSAQELTA